MTSSEPMPLVSIGLARPCINAKPNRKNATQAMAKSATFFCATLIEFLLRTRPASSNKKPACIDNTSNVASRSHTALSGVADISTGRLL